MRNTPSTKLPTRDILPLRIEFHEALVSYFDFNSWAQGGGYTAKCLRSATRNAIRARHHEARIAHPSLKANKHHPDIYALDVDPTKSALVIYTVERGRAVVRGFCLACDTKIAGWVAIEFICEPTWFPGAFSQSTKSSVFELSWPVRE
jgi:hypothetical protein